MMTEEQARKCWCPFTRFHEVSGLGVFHNKPLTDSPTDNGEAGGQSPYCIASRCMAWRFTDKSAWRFRDGEVIETHVEPDSYHGRGGKWVKRGYCGLAGAPR